MTKPNVALLEYSNANLLVVEIYDFGNCRSGCAPNKRFLDCSPSYTQGPSIVNVKFASIASITSVPTRSFIEVDPQRSFGDYFVREERIRRMDRSEAGIAELALMTDRAKDTCVACDV